MDEIEANEQEQRIIKIPAIEIIKKLRTKMDRENFCCENSKFYLSLDWYYHAKEPEFDETFII